MDFEYNLKSFDDLVPYVLGLYSGLLKKDLALIEVGSENQEYKDHVFKREYNLKSFKFVAPPITDKQICKKKLPNTKEGLYINFLDFVAKECIINDSNILKIKANDLAKEFSVSTGTSVDIRNVFPAIMAQFMEIYPFVNKKVTNKGIVYVGICLIKNIDKKTMQILNEENILHNPTISPTSPKLHKNSHILIESSKNLIYDPLNLSHVD
jgi:hypothetical protein